MQTFYSFPISIIWKPYHKIKFMEKMNYLHFFPEMLDILLAMEHNKRAIITHNKPLSRMTSHHHA